MTASTTLAAGNPLKEILVSSDQDSDASGAEAPLGYLSDRPPSDDESLENSDDSDEGSSDSENSSTDARQDDGVTSAKDSSTGNNPPELQNGNGQPPTKRMRRQPASKTKARRVSRRKPVSERRNIRKILKGNQLKSNTLAAQQDELERKRRLQERCFEGASDLATEINENAVPQLKYLLEEAEKQAESMESLAALKMRTTHVNDVVEVIDSDEDECIFVNETAEEEEHVDPENSGNHVNDAVNICDHLGRVLVNISHPEKDPDIHLSTRLGRAVKPHQIGGIRFLYDNVVESMSRFTSSPGFGCILAHSMGLGKTMQVIGFVDVLLRHTSAKCVLIIVPINTLQNWLAEFDMWLPAPSGTTGLPDDDNVFRKFKLHIVNDAHKTVGARAAVIEKWTKEGGVLLMGYEMYRLLATRAARASRRRKNAGAEVIDLDEEDRNKELQLDMQSALVDPGPDLVICDEGHRIKNSHAGISQTLKNLKTKRRVVLTGYPLQNNLMEYWCMVDFVRPNFLGTKVEFSNMFERPITNGQCADSTPQDVRLMRHRAHVLHSLLEGFVQRRNHKVLRAALPPKEEWVLMVKMSPVQRLLYKTFMEDMQQQMAASMGACMNPLKAFAVCCKIWNHPDVLLKFMESKKRDLDDLELDIASSSGASNGGGGKGRLKKSASASNDIADSCSQGVDGLGFADKRDQEVNYDWAVPLLASYAANVVENSGKMVILFSIIEKTVEQGEKLLVFSQSLFALNLLEDYLVHMRFPSSDDCWARNKSYYRLDGSTPGLEREKMITQFNEPGNRASLFLLSTRAGCLGINLIGANRVVILDASWNPCHDCQAVCRVYRYGQKRPCFIYRLVADNTLEKKIYERQINKQGMADRVVDELQPQNRFGKKESEQLLEYEDKDLPSIDTTGIEEQCDDPVLVATLKKNGAWVSQDPFKHESLLIDKQEFRLSKAEKRLAKEGYEREKRMNVSFSRPSYASYYQHLYQNASAGPPPTMMAHHYNVNFPMRLPMPSQAFDYAERGASSAHLLQSGQQQHQQSLSTPIPRNSSCFPLAGGLPAPIMVKPGVTVQHITAAYDIMIGGAGEGGARHIKAGEQVMLVRTSKGMYLRTLDGKIFAVRSQRNGQGDVSADGLHIMLQEQQQHSSHDYGPLAMSSGRSPTRQRGVTVLSSASANQVDHSGHYMDNVSADINHSLTDLRDLNFGMHRQSLTETVGGSRLHGHEGSAEKVFMPSLSSTGSIFESAPFGEDETAAAYDSGANSERTQNTHGEAAATLQQFIAEIDRGSKTMPRPQTTIHHHANGSSVTDGHKVAMLPWMQGSVGEQQSYSSGGSSAPLPNTAYVATMGGHNDYTAFTPATTSYPSHQHSSFRQPTMQWPGSAETLGNGTLPPYPYVGTIFPSSSLSIACDSDDEDDVTVITAAQASC